MSTQMDYSMHERRYQTMEKLEKHLICPVCLEMLSRPIVILPCQHNMCRKCANDTFQTHATALGSGGRFCCPSCQQEVVLDHYGVYGLQRNLLVENIIEIYKQECARPRSVPKSDHLTCKEHEKEKINVYCMSCEVLTCCLCKVFGKHRNCNVVPLIDICKRLKADLRNGIELLVASNDKIQDAMSRLKETHKQIEENCEIQKQALCAKFEHMSAILEERKKLMLQKITLEEQEKAENVLCQVKQYNKLLKSSSTLMETVLESIQDSDMAASFQNANILLQKISEMTQNLKIEELELSHENMDHYTADFDAVEHVLNQLDFVNKGKEASEEKEECVAEGDSNDASESMDYRINLTESSASSVLQTDTGTNKNDTAQDELQERNRSEAEVTAVQQCDLEMDEGHGPINLEMQNTLTEVEEDDRVSPDCQIDSPQLNFDSRDLHHFSGKVTVKESEESCGEQLLVAFPASTELCSAMEKSTLVNEEAKSLNKFTFGTTEIENTKKVLKTEDQVTSIFSEITTSAQ
ncbi:tripartite motif-containing protein 54-like isoform X2 [Protopterus annectens]|uniref:tripartite motif-containing protein 54-like isoform X2 n=1 Tax=Protopterus annectens TaxID=7888 RepID=UPI001CFC1F38|nr:tripartite motif-containing protein 54-like isoform X2 [Protopterus annectens]